mgnify:FL=1
MYFGAHNNSSNNVIISRVPLEKQLIKNNSYGLTHEFDFSIKLNESDDYTFFISKTNNPHKRLFEFKLNYCDIVDTLYSRYDDGYLNSTIRKSFMIDYPKKELIIEVLIHYLPLELILIIIHFLKMKINVRFYCTYKNNIYLSKPKIYIPSIFNV